MRIKFKQIILSFLFLIAAGLLIYLFLSFISELPVRLRLTHALLISVCFTAVYYLYSIFRAKIDETKILEDQIKKSALIMTRQEELSKKVSKEMALLNSNILMSKQQLQSTFDAINEKICVLDTKLNIFRVNRSYSQLVEIPILDLLGRKCYQVLWDTDEPCKNCPARETIKTGKIQTRKQYIKHKDTQTCYYEISAYPVRDENNNVVSVIEVINDVTEDRHMTAQLIRSEKLATIGIMTAGIAHEMNNPLSGISGNAANMLEMAEKYGLNEKGVQRVEAMREASERATRIMRTLLDLSRRQDSKLVFSDLNKVIEKSLESIHLPGYRATKKIFKPDPTLRPVKCDADKIGQVLLNIITNAFYGIEEKMEARKEQGNDKSYEGVIKINHHQTGKKSILSIEDNGIGIPEEKKKFIFDPFFTTRPPGKGTGLGLSICHRIIEEHSGNIKITSSGSKTCFVIELPISGPE